MNQWKKATGCNIFNDIKNIEENIVVCFDLLKTRERINNLHNTRELKKFAKKIKQSFKEKITASSQEAFKQYKTTVGEGVFLRYKAKTPDFTKGMKTILIQDTVVVIFDLQKLIKEKYFYIDIELSKFFLFILEFCRQFADSLLFDGYLFRGALSAGTLHYENRLVLGNAFIDAYDHIDGEKKENIIGVQVSSLFLRFQNFIHTIVPNVHCSCGEFLKLKHYIKMNDAIFVNPGVKDLYRYQLLIKQLQNNNCNPKFHLQTANFFGEAFKMSPLWNGDESVIEQFKHYNFPDV